MTSPATLPEDQSPTLPTERPQGPALVVLWAPQEPHFVGASLLLPQGGSSIFGRGDTPPEEGLPRVLLRWQRPGGATLAPPVTNNRLSRSQIRLTPGPNGQLGVENTGLCPLVFRKQEVSRGDLAEGDVFSLGNQMAFLFTRRPAVLPGACPAFAGPFGRPDERGLVGESPAAWKLRQELVFLAQRDEHVLVNGPSGSGKELVARALHDLSRRARFSLVSRNAATIPEALVDAELFGNLKNYPNPGTPERPGLIGQADRGTLFLDEFAELPRETQTHLLRVLDAGEYQRLGDAFPRRSDFRLVAATNRPVESLKHDLAARFVLRLWLLGLNERREDVPLLAHHILRSIASRDPDAVRRFFPAEDFNGTPRLSRDLTLVLVQHTYTTHTRELAAFLWDSLRQSPEDELLLPDTLRSDLPEPEPEPEPEPDDPAPQASGVSAEVLQKALDENNGSLEKTWRVLGLPNRYALRRLIQKYNVEVRRKIPPDTP